MTQHFSNAHHTLKCHTFLNTAQTQEHQAWQSASTGCVRDAGHLKSTGTAPRGPMEPSPHRSPTHAALLSEPPWLSSVIHLSLPSHPPTAKQRYLRASAPEPWPPWQLQPTLQLQPHPLPLTMALVSNLGPVWLAPVRMLTTADPEC